MGYDYFFHCSPDLLCILDREARIEELNEVWTARFGYSLSSLQGSNLLELVHHDDRADVQQVLLQTYAPNERVDSLQARLRSRQGEYHPLRWSLVWGDNRTYVTLRELPEATLLNPSPSEVTEHRTGVLLEQSLAQSNVTAHRRDQLLATIFDHSPLLIFLKDTETWRYTLWNRQGEIVHRTPASKVLGKSDFELFPAELATKLRQDDEEVVRTGRPMEFDDEVPEPDGSILVYRCIKFPLVDEDGHPYALCGIALDITHAKRIEEHLRRATRAAEDANRTKNLFLASISHEIRDPLNGIIGMTELVLDSTLSDDQREMLQTVSHSALSLVSIVNDLLDLSRIESGKFELRKLVFEPGQVLDEVMSLIARRASERGVTVQPNLPAVSHRLIGDPGRLKQVLLNLLFNAVQFSKRGTHVAVEVRMLERTDDLLWLQFSVSDHGPGIPQDQLERIFEPFTQVNPPHSGDPRGAGLGLFIASQLVELMGGRIQVESSLGAGSRFTFEIPFRTASRDFEELSSKPEFIGRIEVEPGLRILVVEDHLVNQTLTRRLLESAGCEVATASNGREALDALLQGSFDGVILDLQMPIMDGYEAARHIRDRRVLSRRGEPIPVIALTAHAFDQERQKCLGQGMVAFVAKPFERNELLKQVQLLFGSGEPGQGTDRSGAA